MLGISRRTGVAALLVSQCLFLVGCLAPKESIVALPGSNQYALSSYPAVKSPQERIAPLGGYSTASTNTASTGGVSTAVASATPTPAIQRTSFLQTTGDPKSQPASVDKTPMVGGPAFPVQGAPAPGPLPRELIMTSLPPYTVAPPDILVIDAFRLIPKPPYHVEPLEVLLINVTDTLPNQPIVGPFVVSPEGSINLGFGYGSVHVGGLTLEEVQNTIREHLSQTLRSAQVTVSLAQFRGLQQIKGEHLVRPDGTISLGTYGAVYVAGLSLGQVKCVVEKHLSDYLLNPQISVDIYAYNSKAYYVIFDGGGFGQQVFRLPITGNETVLDAISQVQGLAPVSSKKYIWLARPAPARMGCNQILPVDWDAITQGGSTATNYQIFPGDRIYVRADALIKLDNYMSKIFAPIERVLGMGLLAANTAESFSSIGQTSGTFTVP